MIINPFFLLQNKNRYTGVSKRIRRSVLEPAQSLAMVRLSTNSLTPSLTTYAFSCATHSAI